MTTTETLYEITPAADIYELDDAYLILIDLPGVTETDLEIELDRNILKLTGRPKICGCGKERTESQCEYRTGTFTRSFTLGSGIDRESVKATMKDGVLTLRLGKGKELVPRRIAITKG